LFKGYRVVAIEADPDLIEGARQRFAEPIRQGRLQLLNVAIGPKEETARFWICEEHSEWNSFFKEIASREGSKCHAIDIPCRPFGALLGEHGVPYYLKVDIEGYDHYCLDDLDASNLPRYVSLEMSRFEDLFTLRNLGYGAFKLITQNDHRQLAVRPFSIKELLKRQLRSHPSLFRLGRRVVGLRRRVAPLVDPRTRSRVAAGGTTERSWQFAHGSSGPFGEDTDGPWRTLEEVAYTWLIYQLGQSHYGPPSLAVWHDLHARLDGAAR